MRSKKEKNNVLWMLNKKKKREKGKNFISRNERFKRKQKKIFKKIEMKLKQLK